MTEGHGYYTSSPEPPLGDAAGPELRSVRIRLLPWQPRWRAPEIRGGDSNLDIFDVDLDDPISAVLSLVVLIVLLPVVLGLLLGVAMFSVEMLALLPVVLLVMSAQLLSVRPWVLVCTDITGRRWYVPVRGTPAMWRRRRELRTQRRR